MAETGWLAASKAIDLIPGAGLSQGRAIIKLAAHGVVQTRAKSISGFAPWEPEEGWYYFDTAFWKLLNMTGYQSDWAIGEFRSRRRIGDKNDPMVIVGAQFEERELRDALGLPVLERTHTELSESQPAQVPLQDDRNAPDGREWDRDEMTAAILAYGCNDRDLAWREHFKHRKDEHGWSNVAFVSHWSEARGTKGRKGRPPKSGY